MGENKVSVLFRRSRQEVKKSSKRSNNRSLPAHQPRETTRLRGRRRWRRCCHGRRRRLRVTQERRQFGRARPTSSRRCISGLELLHRHPPCLSRPGRHWHIPRCDMRLSGRARIDWPVCVVSRRHIDLNGDVTTLGASHGPGATVQ